MINILFTGNRSGSQRKIKATGGLILVVILIFLGLAMFSNGGFTVNSDGSNYFAYLRSAVFDRDLDFHNEFSRFDKAFWDTYKPKETPTGHYTNVFSVGPAVLWAPFYLAAHLFVIISNLLGAGFTPDGFSAPYLAAVNLGSLIYSFAGICLAYRLCRQFFDRWPSLLASASVWLATFITYYVVYQPFMSHAVSFFTVTLFVYYWQRTRPRRTAIQWALLGLAAGLMMLVRWQNGLIMIIPALESLISYISAVFAHKWAVIRSLLKNNILFLASMLAAFSPQIAAWKMIYGSFFTIPQGTGFLRWNAPFIWEVLFSSRHGLFSWSPIVYFAAIGWLMFVKRDRLLAAGLTAAFVLMLYMNSIISDWWAGWGFGMRRFDAFILLFALGLAEVLQRLKKINPSNAIIIGTGFTVLFSGFNWYLMGLVNNRSIHPGGPVAFNRVYGLRDTGIYHLTGNPFSFPANVIFAARYKLPPSRYDTLVGGYIDDPNFYGDTIKPADNVTLLGAGWSSPLTYKGIKVRTIENRAIVYAPVRTVTDFALTIAAAGEKVSPEGISVFLNSTKVGLFKPKPEPAEYVCQLPEKFLLPGINIIEFNIPAADGQVFVSSLQFNRLKPVPDWR